MCIQGEKNLNDLLSNQRDNVSKEGIGFASKKKNNKKKSVVSSLPNMTTFVKEGEKSQVSSNPAQAGVSGVKFPATAIFLGTYKKAPFFPNGSSSSKHNFSLPLTSIVDLGKLVSLSIPSMILAYL